MNEPATATTHDLPADADAAVGPGAEWLETDGLGGFASSTAAMCPARRYHGLLVAPRPGTATRHVYLAGLLERMTTRVGTIALSSLREAGDPPATWPDGHRASTFVPWPQATHAAGPFEIRREVLMVRGRHVVLVRYSLAPAAETEDVVSLLVRPLLSCREADRLHVENDVLDPSVEHLPHGARCRPYDTLPAVTLEVETASRWSFEPEPRWYTGVEYERDLARGFEGHEDLFSPGALQVRLRPGHSVTLAATIDDGGTANIDALWSAEAARRETGANDLRARVADGADDFLYTGPGERAGVLAGFPWFGEWGRDTFIALPGLTLARGQLDACAEVLSGARAHLDQGLVPNIFGADKSSSHYGSVDASLWFARAVLQFQRAGGDETRVFDEYLPALGEIQAAYEAGRASRIRALGIRGDDDGLVRAGTPELNPTWMDAKAAGIAVTPRHGCPVEIEALWVSLLKHLTELSRMRGDVQAEKRWRAAARRASRAFLDRFWLEDDGYLADVWRPGDLDVSVRPNMVLAASLELSPLTKAHRARILERAEAELLTPLGLRTLSPRHPDYQARYEGGPETRDGAYHQGTVWPWLLGFHCEAALRVDASRRNRTRLAALWAAFEGELDRAGIGHVSEVYDGDAPQRPGGTFAQAWNTAEWLRATALLDGTLALRKPRTR